MRLIRLGALFGSLMLLVATLVSLINQRSELFHEQDARVVTASTAVSTSVQNTLLRSRAVTSIATSETLPTELIATFSDGAQACVGSECTGPDLAALAAFGDALDARREDGTGAVVDSASSSVLIVASAGGTTASIQIPFDGLVGVPAQTAIADSGVEYRVDVADGTPLTGMVRTVDGQRVIESQIAAPFDDGSLVVETSTPDDVGWGAESPGLFALLLGFGTVLLALAGWTFLAERRQLERRATTDELTGLVNRREFERQSEEAIEIAGRFGTGLCIMLIDLNGFKQINDTLGHQFGDLVLKACADRLVDAVRDTDVVGRWGGDEFVVLLPGLEEASAVRNSAERIGSSLSSTPVTGDVSISGSVGAALFPRHGATFGDLMQAADVAMYEAKTSGVIHRLASAAVDIPSPPVVGPEGYDGPERRRSTTHADAPADARR